MAQELSRGMRQKVAICCAYLHDPKAILFDEPLTGLDPYAIRTLKASIAERAAAGAAIMVSSHLLSLVEDLCTHLLILNKGQSLFYGSLAEARVAVRRLAGRGVAGRGVLPGDRTTRRESWIPCRAHLAHASGPLQADRTLDQVRRSAGHSAERGRSRARFCILFTIGVLFADDRASVFAAVMMRGQPGHAPVQRLARAVPADHDPGLLSADRFQRRARWRSRSLRPRSISCFPRRFTAASCSIYKLVKLFLGAVFAALFFSMIDACSISTRGSRRSSASF